jgi:hypothetical protein
MFNQFRSTETVLPGVNVRYLFGHPLADAKRIYSELWARSGDLPFFLEWLPAEFGILGRQMLFHLS